MLWRSAVSNRGSPLETVFTRWLLSQASGTIMWPRGRAGTRQNLSPIPCVRHAFLGSHLWNPGLHTPLSPSAVGPRHPRGGGRARVGASGVGREGAGTSGRAFCKSCSVDVAEGPGRLGLWEHEGEGGKFALTGAVMAAGSAAHPEAGGMGGAVCLWPVTPGKAGFPSPHPVPDPDPDPDPGSARRPQAVRAQMLGVRGAHHARAWPRGDRARGRSGQELPHEVLQV